jgi:hypothetical protein
VPAGRYSAREIVTAENRYDMERSFKGRWVLADDVLASRRVEIVEPRARQQHAPTCRTERTHPGDPEHSGMLAALHFLSEQVFGDSYLELLTLAVLVSAFATAYKHICRLSAG